MTGVLDTNVVLYLLGGRISSPLPEGDYGISVITEMELLSWPTLTPLEEKEIEAFLQKVAICDLTPAIRRRAVRLGREHRLKLPDAIICATALENQVGLWTNDQRLLTVMGASGHAVSPTPATPLAGTPPPG